MLSAIENDAEASPAAPPDAVTKRIANLASEQLRFARLIAAAEKDLAELNESFKEISERLLPDAMAEAGVTAFELTDGSKISVKPFYGASITAENQAPCHAWLEENGHGSLIKKGVSVDLEKGDTESFQSVTESLDELGVGYKVKEGIHASTLNAFVKDQVQSGVDFPMEMFKVFTGRKAKIQGPK
jgi:hypothetical protein